MLLATESPKALELETEVAREEELLNAEALIATTLLSALSVLVVSSVGKGVVEEEVEPTTMFNKLLTEFATVTREVPVVKVAFLPTAALPLLLVGVVEEEEEEERVFAAREEKEVDKVAVSKLRVLATKVARLSKSLEVTLARPDAFVLARDATEFPRTEITLDDAVSIFPATVASVEEEEEEEVKELIADAMLED